MKNVRLFYSMTVLSIVIFSCKEAEKPEPVVAAVGTYNYKVKLYYLEGTTPIYLGANYDQSGTAIVSKTATGFEVKQGGDIVFTGSKVTAATNGFTFNIESSTITTNGNTVIVDGYDGATLGTTKYNGLFESKTKVLTSYLQFKGYIPDENQNPKQVTIVLEFVGTKI
jgi:hypothetical protein